MSSKWEWTVEDKRGQYDDTMGACKDGLAAMKTGFESAYLMPYDGIKEFRRSVVFRCGVLFWRECDE